MAFPLLSPHGIQPSSHINGNSFTIIVRRARSTATAYQAAVVYGPENRVFAASWPADTDKTALQALLEVTYGLIGKLYDEKKLSALTEDMATVITGGAYESGSAD